MIFTCSYKQTLCVDSGITLNVSYNIRQAVCKLCSDRNQLIWSELRK